MTQTTLITGAGTGIGYQLALALLVNNPCMHIIAIGRRSDKLQLLSVAYPNRVLAIAADVATEDGRHSIIEGLSSVDQIDYLVHSAATAQPLTTIKNLSLADWRHAIQTNMEAPLFLTQMLLHKCKHSRVLFFTSEPKVEPVHGASTYCISKVGQQMIYESFKTETPKEQAIFAMVSPGLVDTAMQADIRQADPKELPAASVLAQLYSEHKLLSAETVAKFVSWLLLEVEEDAFSNNSWDIYHQSHQSSWMPTERTR